MIILRIGTLNPTTHATPTTTCSYCNWLICYMRRTGAVLSVLCVYKCVASTTWSNEHDTPTPTDGRNNSALGQQIFKLMSCPPSSPHPSPLELNSNERGARIKKNYTNSTRWTVWKFGHYCLIPTQFIFHWLILFLFCPSSWSSFFFFFFFSSCSFEHMYNLRPRISVLI